MLKILPSSREYRKHSLRHSPTRDEDKWLTEIMFDFSGGDLFNKTSWRPSSEWNRISWFRSVMSSDRNNNVQHMTGRNIQ